MADFKKSMEMLGRIVDLNRPPAPQRIIRASDAFSPFVDKAVGVTMADRTKAEQFGKFKGGARFPFLQNVDPAYQGQTWGFGKKGMATRMHGQFEDIPEEELLISTILGKKDMLKSNPEVFSDLVKQYKKGMKSGLLTDELRAKTNRVLAGIPADDTGKLMFGPDVDIGDPAFFKSLDTFDKRREVGNILGGVGVGGKKGQLFDYDAAIKKYIEPSLYDAPNMSVGSRIFTLSGTKAERPDLNAAYPHVVGGLDLGVDFTPVPRNTFLKDYHEDFMSRGKVPGWYNITQSSSMPYQKITDEWLQHLKDRGYAEGGEVEHMQAGGVKKALGALEELAQAAPKTITHSMLRRRGMGISSKDEADALYSSGHRIFGMHEMDEIPFEITDRSMFDNYAPDLLMAYPPEKTLLKADGGQVEHMQSGGIKSAIGALTQAERAANLAKYMEGAAIPDRLYHATTATQGGKGTEALRNLKPSKEGALGSGIYMTPDTNYANTYAQGEGGNFLPLFTNMRNPLKITGEHKDPMKEALIKLGVDPEKADTIVERAYETNGYIGKQVQSRAQAQGFDGIAQYRDGDLSEVVAFNPNSVKSAIGNTGEYMPYSGLLGKAEGGSVEHMQAGGVKGLIGAGAKVGAPSVMTRSGISDLADYIKSREGVFGMRRVERAADEIPKLGELYQEQALRRAFSGDNAQALMTMKPSEFERYAAPLMDPNLTHRTYRPYQNTSEGVGVKSGKEINYDDYIKSLIGVQKTLGFEDVPFLQINKKQQGSIDLPYISGHEGRHRSRAMDEAGEQASLVQLVPRGELRDPYPRSSHEEDIAALYKEMQLTGSRVKPQRYFNNLEQKDIQRPAIDLPDLYADGGQVEHMQSGGIKNLVGAGAKILPKAERDLNLTKFLEDSALKQRLYHGSNQMRLSDEGVHIYAPNEGFSELLPSGTGVLKSEFDKHPPAVFLSPNPDFASRFAGLQVNEATPAVYPVHAKVKNPFDYANQAHMDALEREYIKTHIEPRRPAEGESLFDFKKSNAASINELRRTLENAKSHDANWNTLEDAKIQQAIRNLGHDAFYVTENGVKNIGVYDPKMIKSATGNQGTYDITTTELNKAHGGQVEHMQAGGLKTGVGLILPEVENAIAGIKEVNRMPIIPMPNRWFLQPDKFPQMQGMVEKVLERSGLPRESFTSGAYANPVTGEILDRKIFEDVGVAINPATNRPMMSAGKEAGIEELEKELGSLTRSNLVRKGLFKRTGGDKLLDDINFLATIERSGMGHKYGLATEYGSPTQMFNTGKSGNPTLRPTSRGDVFGMGDVLGQIQLGKGPMHDVYEKLFVAPKGMDVPGVKLHEAEGGAVNMQTGGMTKTPVGGDLKHTSFQELRHDMGMAEGGDIMHKLVKYAAAGGEIDDLQHTLAKKYLETLNG